MNNFRMDKTRPINNAAMVNHQHMYKKCLPLHEKFFENSDLTARFDRKYYAPKVVIEKKDEE